LLLLHNSCRPNALVLSAALSSLFDARYLASFSLPFGAPLPDLLSLPRNSSLPSSRPSLARS